MWNYIDYMIHHCTRCKLSNALTRNSAELVNSFPADELMKVVNADVYTVGADTSFLEYKNFMFLICGMCTFVFWESLTEMNSTKFAGEIMKILLNEGFFIH